MKKLLKFLKSEKGQGMVEYGLILGLIAIAVIGVLVLFKAPLTSLFTKAKDALASAAGIILLP